MSIDPRDPRFNPQLAAMMLDQQQAPDMGPSKVEQRRMAAINVAINITSTQYAPVKLDPDPAKAGTQLCGLAKVVEKYLDSGN